MADPDQQMRFEDRGIFEPGAAVRALRDAGYRHPANAIAELIDNSWDARASRVDVLIEERREVVTTRRRWRVNKLAVADNGTGMDARALVQALRVGGRTASQRVQAIGKYGMGLPTASASQCQRVDVWTWQKTIEQPFHCWFDTRAIESGEMKEIPEANREPVPLDWRQRISPNTLDLAHGTLVVWSDIDRITERIDTIFKKIEREIGRTYRHFINDKELIIRMANFQNNQLQTDTVIRPNDPLFLMKNSATSFPWNEDPMFRQYGENKIYPITVEGREEHIEVTYSIAKKEVIANVDDGKRYAGETAHGQDASRNIGVSVVRENRELLMEKAFIREGGGSREPRNRWWGCEIRFGSGLDDVFGVDHNKQMAVALSNAAVELMNSDKDTGALLEELGVSGDDPIYKIVADIRNTTRNMVGDIRNLLDARWRLRSSVDSEDTKKLTPEEETETRMSADTQATIDSGGPVTKTDFDHETAEDERGKNLTERLTEEGVIDAEEVVAKILRNDFRYKFINKALSGRQMFSVDSDQGVLLVYLNIDHLLLRFLDHPDEDSPLPSARRGIVALRTLLLAWARVEDQIENRERRQDVQDLAVNWGREATGTLDQLVKEMEAEAAAEEDS